MHNLHSCLKAWRISLVELLAPPSYSVVFLLPMVLLGFVASAAQSTDSVFPTPIASVYESRIAFIAQPAPKKLRLDIGVSVDLFRVVLDTTRPPMKLGVDFMTYTRLRSEHNLKFPVETIDYWFGVRAEYAPTPTLSLRLRAAHISAHLVDGLVDTSAAFSDKKPFVYSREFLEALAVYAIHTGVHVYAGATVVTSTQPRRADRIIPQAGLDVRVPLVRDLSLRGGYDWRLVGVDGTYVTAQAAQLGVFWNTMGDGRGLLVALHGYNGRSMHGMFYDQADSYLGIGLQVIW